jgi:hypothetical protein
MNVRWVYSCDFGHDWAFFRDEHAEEKPEDLVCPHGHPAVALRKDRPADLLTMVIRPTATEDPVKPEKLYGEGYYQLVLVNRDGVQERASKKAYPLQDILKLCERFAGRLRERVLLLWDRSLI